MTSILAHRGPDDENVYLNGNVGLGHRRLSIIDLDGGRQPMSNDDGSVVVTFNGEIYNYRDLRNELAGKYAFRTNSDTEVLLHLYEEKGDDCVQSLRGMFAFAIYDFRQRKLLAARDHLGQKPFYYHHDGHLFAFGSEPFKTFSGDVPYKDYSELPFAELVSRRFGTEHRPLTIRPSLVRTLPDLAWHLDEPSDPLSLCVYFLSELARKELKVVLGGDGGDELFGGYDRYYGNILVSYYAALALRRHLLSKLIQLVPEGFWYRSFSHKLKWMHQLSFYEGSERYAKSLSYFYFSDAFKRQLYTGKFLDAVGAFDPEACLKDQFDCDNAKQVLDRMLHADNMVRMPDHPVMILDRMTMAHGLEAHSPFLDHKIAEFCASIPPRFKVRGNKRRLIHLEIGKRHLPNEIITKKKQGFSSPLTYLLKDEFSSLYKCLLTDSRLVQEGYLRQEGIRALLDQHLGEKVDHGNRLWLLCNSEVWYRMFIDGLTREEMGEVLGPATPRQPAAETS